MSFLSMLYTLLISPLQLLFEVIFSVAYRLIGNAGVSIIFLSIAVNFLVLPLYKRADELQAEEREIQAKMAYRIKRTKQTFKGDERFFMLQEYYRINNYKPVYALKSSASLLLQIPFFIAAYRLLSDMQILQGASFGFIFDLGMEDALFTIGNFPVNVLPILMTLINVVTAIIYTKGHPIKEKIQVYGLAALFLILLYRSPSGLVFYWLLNNVFSLIKNIFKKLKEPKKALNFMLAAFGITIIIFSLLMAETNAKEKTILAISGCLLMLPLTNNYFNSSLTKTKKKTNNKGIFLLGTIFMAVFTGLLIPTNVIGASPAEFIDMYDYKNPMLYVENSLVLSLGFFVLWGGVFYFFSSENIKQLFEMAICIICGCSTIDYMFFGKKLGILSNSLQYDNGLIFSTTEYVVNILSLSLTATVLCAICIYKSSIAKTILLVGTVASASVGFINSKDIVAVYKDYGIMHTIVKESSDKLPEITLSKNGKNVIIFMLDRSIGPQLPYLLKEKPELKGKFDGFTYYPNTISFGSATIFGTPALFGGYEYTPEKINARSQESLESKQNEALKVLPVLFDKNGYKVTVSDPSYAGYKLTPDLSIYDEYPQINKFNLHGQFDLFSNALDGQATSKASEYMEKTLNRNLLCFALMKSAPLLLQESMYNDGLYNKVIEKRKSSDKNSDLDVFKTDSLTQTCISLSKAQGVSLAFLRAYAPVNNLDKITNVSDDSQNTFLMMTSKSAHNYCMLQEPDYTPSVHVDNTAYDVNMIERYTIDGVTMRMDDINQINSYHVNAASLMALGKWFDYLREMGVYDNTRIIIVSDHGARYEQFNRVHETGVDMDLFMPLLLVKEFNQTGFKSSNDLMTNADTPALAVRDIIDNPINPFSGNKIDAHEKKGPLKVFFSDYINIEENHGNVYLPGKWFELQGNPYNIGSWKYLGEK